MMGKPHCHTLSTWRGRLLPRPPESDKAGPEGSSHCGTERERWGLVPAGSGCVWLLWTLLQTGRTQKAAIQRQAGMVLILSVKYGFEAKDLI